MLIDSFDKSIDVLGDSRLCSRIQHLGSRGDGMPCLAGINSIPRSLFSFPA